MKLQLGSMLIKVFMNETAVVVFPVGSHMVAIRAEIFRGELTSDSVQIVTEVYHKENISMRERVGLWLNGE